MCCMWVQYVSKKRRRFFLFLCNRGSFFFVGLCRFVCYFILLVGGKIWDSLCCLSLGLGPITKDIKYNGKKPRDENHEAIHYFYYHSLWQQKQQGFGLHSLYPVGVHPDVPYNSAGCCFSFQIQILTESGSIVGILYTFFFWEYNWAGSTFSVCPHVVQLPLCNKNEQRLVFKHHLVVNEGLASILCRTYFLL